jgi:hypothetical protein
VLYKDKLAGKYAAVDLPEIPAGTLLDAVADAYHAVVAAAKG